METNSRRPTIKKTSPTYIIVCMYFLLSGVEYAVILPTLNMYLLSLGAQTYFIGLVMSSFSLTGLLSAPIYGRVTDLTGSTKAAVVFSNVFEIGGNFMYFSAFNPYMVLGSRLLAGLGSGSGSSIFGMISRSTSKEERTAAFSHLMALRQIGLIIGPAFNLFLQKLHFHIGPFSVNSFTSPGIFMAILWAIHTFLVISFYKELVAKERAESSSNNVMESDMHVGSELIKDISEISEFPPYAMPKVDEKKITPIGFFSYVYNDLLREEVIVCLGITFVLMFVQTGMETMLTPLTLQLFDWGEFLNSIFFFAAGILIVLSFLALGALSKSLPDRMLLVIGLSVMLAAYVLFVAVVIPALNAPVGTTWVVVVFCMYSAVLVLAIPFAWVPQASLFSKVTSETTQGFNQGIRLFVMGIGQILGPLWAGFLLNRLIVIAAVNVALISLILTMVLASFKRLYVQGNSSSLEPNSTEPGPSESTPLLSDGEDALRT